MRRFVVLLVCAVLVDGCSTAGGSESDSSAAAVELDGTYAAQAPARVATYTFTSATQYELRLATCEERACVTHGTYKLGPGDSVELSDDGTGHPVSFPLTVEALASSSHSESVRPLGAGMGLVHTVDLLSKVTGFGTPDGADYLLVGTGGSCNGRCVPTWTVYTPYSGTLKKDLCTRGVGTCDGANETCCL
jgi:hypothetical protein